MCEDELNFHMFGKLHVHYIYSFLALNSTHIISEAPNLNSTFVFMLLVTVLSFIDW